jgi:hypothetical protein
MSDAGALLQRLDAVEQRLDALARTPRDAVTGRHTDPDPPTGETWEWGQVWAHLAEFIPYWLDQARDVVTHYGGEPVPFGRTKSDAGRIAAIERDRDVDVATLASRLHGQIGDARVFLRELPDGAWSVRGQHPTLGVMDLAHILDEFVVGHLEQHAAQLDALVG